MSNPSLPVTYEYKLECGDKVTVKKLVLKKYIEITKSLENLIKDVYDQFIDTDNAFDFYQIIPSLIINSFPELCKFLSIALDKDIEYIEENITLDDAIELANKILEINEFNKILGKLKNLMWTLFPSLKQITEIASVNKEEEKIEEIQNQE